MDSGDKNAAVLFSSYQGISAVSGAIALMAFSALSSVMGFRYAIKEYSGSNAILLFCYPVSRKSVLWAKMKLLLIFESITLFFVIFGSFVIFAATGKIKKSNSVTVISAVLGSMVLANAVAQINKHFLIVSGLAAVIFTMGILFAFNLARKINGLEI